MTIHGFTQTVTLADGTVLNGYAGRSSLSGEIWVWLDEGTSMVTAFGLFSDPEKTATIRTDLTEDTSETYEGYTTMSLIREDEGKVTIRMRK